VVARRGSELSWGEQDGAIVVEQSAGNVFYRVQSGNRFSVNTPGGQVIVRGTSFRVEVRQMKMAQVAGAALAGAVTVVALYEGSVLIANDHGELSLEPGEVPEERWVRFRPEPMPEPLRDALSRHVFRHHRRQVAASRLETSAGSES